ncbi:MAG: hypothetical protein V4657_13180 [Pseudomonadota bacterium]
MTQKIDPLAKMREPFPHNQISKLPKETKKQAEQRKADIASGNWPAKCKVCEGLHHPNAVHLDYVGHAALTDRMLDADMNWTWEPVAFTDLGLPAFDQTGGLWIRLTIGGVTRLGYGHAAAKPQMDPGAREKEVIGDALRNAAMRFGAALDLWHKGDLHLDDEPEAKPAPKAVETKAETKPAGDFITEDQRVDLMAMFDSMNVNVKHFLERTGIKTLPQLSAARFSDAVALINEMSLEKDAA